MRARNSFFRRLTVAAALAVGVVSTGLLGASTAGADPTPPRSGSTLGPPPLLLSQITVQRTGTTATVAFTSTEPTAAWVAVRSLVRTGPGLSPSVPPPVAVADAPGATALLPAGATLTSGAPRLRSFTSQHRLQLSKLQSGTSYDVQVEAESQSGKRLTRQVRFDTLKQRIRITMYEILIVDDGDWFGDGEPMWTVGMRWDGGESAGCYPYIAGLPNLPYLCKSGHRGSGVHVPRNRDGELLSWVIAEENVAQMPSELWLSVEGHEEDFISAPCGGDWIPLGCPYDGADENPRPDWRVPQGVERSIHEISKRADTGSGFVSHVYFRFELFYDDASYPPMHGRVTYDTWR